MAKGGERGFTVVELLIAIALFGIVMPSVILGVMALVQINDRAGDLSQANMIAESKIESLRSLGYTSLVTGTTSFVSELPTTFDDPRSASYTVSNFNNSATSGMKEISVAISYNSYGKTVSLQYKSIIGELGISQ
jgi:prepilin-type N-terminal cleavage/methylation domain-containing protein